VDVRLISCELGESVGELAAWLTLDVDTAESQLLSPILLPMMLDFEHVSGDAVRHICGQVRRIDEVLPRGLV